MLYSSDWLADAMRTRLGSGNDGLGYPVQPLIAFGLIIFIFDRSLVLFKSVVARRNPAFFFSWWF
jgi:hypothetical protein